MGPNPVAGFQLGTGVGPADGIGPAAAGVTAGGAAGCGATGFTGFTMGAVAGRPS